MKQPVLTVPGSAALNRRTWTWAILVIGFTSISAQILFMREWFTLFYGNELSLGILFGVWLFWTAVGSGPLAKCVKTSGDGRRPFARIQLFLALSIPLTYGLIHAIRTLAGFTPGEMIGLVPMFIIPFFVMPIVCIPSGLLYTLGCGLFRNQKTGFPIARVYILEALGSAAGGLASSMVLIPYLKPVELIFLLSSMNAFCGILMGFRNKKTRLTIIIPIVLLLLITGYTTSGILQNRLDVLLWRGYNLLDSRNTPYGTLSAVQLEDQVTFFENGIPVFTVPDIQTAEESVHYALFEHPAPQNVLLIGGGPAGSIREILKHPTIRSVDYVELDPEIIAMAKQHLPAGEIHALSDPRVHVHLLDGRRFLKTAANRFDVILLLLPNPYTAQLNRFYTREFFSEANRALRPGGVFSLQVSSSENAVGPELAAYLVSVKATLAGVFTDLVVIPGETARFIASNQKGQLTSDAADLIARIRTRKIQMRYFREYYLPYQLSKERRDYLDARLVSVPSVRINTDLRPMGYVYDALLWATGFSAWIKPVYRFFSGLSVFSLMALVCLSAILFLVWNLLHGTKSVHACLCIVAAAGFTQISIQWILILAFQILYGVAYRQMALIIAGFMCGLAAGSALAPADKRKSLPAFLVLQCVMVIYPFCVSLTLQSLSEHAISLPISGALFLLLAGCSGMLAGSHFTLANRILVRQGQSIQKTAGKLYSADLFGACIGAVLVSAFLVPIFGIPNMLILLVWVNLCGLVILNFAFFKIPGSPEHSGLSLRASSR